MKYDADPGDPIGRWFESRGWTPFAFQREVWEAYRAGESGLVHAATGTGKTLAAWGGPLLDACRSEPSAREARAQSRNRHSGREAIPSVGTTAIPRSARNDTRPRRDRPPP